MLRHGKSEGSYTKWRPPPTIRVRGSQRGINLGNATGKTAAGRTQMILEMSAVRENHSGSTRCSENGFELKVSSAAQRSLKIGKHTSELQSQR